jgi:hypothetical protein
MAMDNKKAGKASDADVSDIVSRLKAQGKKRRSDAGDGAGDEYVLKKSKKSKKEKS